MVVILTTFAGTGLASFNGQTGKSTEMDLDYPNGLYVLPDGLVYISDNVNFIVRHADRKGELTTVFEDPVGFHHGRGL